jgi:phosphohistidine phosphatase
MKLYFVRHTTAADVAPDDAHRPLTRQGEEEARRVGAALANLGVQPTRIFSSPLLRARQTAGIIAEELKFAGQIEPVAELNNDTPTAKLLAVLPARGELILVGHMPSLAQHVAALTAAANPDELAFSKGSVAFVELSGNTGKLHWLKHLRQLLPPN